jgi:hypothetical protein
MKTRKTWFLVLMVSVLALVACAPTEASACPTATADSKLLTNTEDGYCLLYPAENVADMPGWVVINPISAPGDMPGEAWLNIQVQDAAGKTAAQIVDEQIVSLGEGFNITHFEVEMDGEQAVVVDGLPGVDSNRQVFIVHNGRLYDLVFMPWFPNAAEPTPLETLYTTAVDTFHFMPQDQIVRSSLRPVGCIRVCRQKPNSAHPDI